MEVNCYHEFVQQLAGIMYRDTQTHAKIKLYSTPKEIRIANCDRDASIANSNKV